MHLRAATIALAIALCSCSNGGNPAAGGAGDAPADPATGGPSVPADQDAAGGADSGAACGSASYPAGPYDSTVGKVLPNLDFVGYVSFDAGTALVSARPKGTFSFLDLMHTCKPYALIHLGAYWCGPCRSTLSGIVQAWPDVQAKGGAVVEILADGSSPGTAPTQSQLDAWIKSTSTPFTSVIDPPSAPSRALNTIGYDVTLVVDLKTMKVLYVQDAGYTDAVAFLMKKLGGS
jgi:thiol-disulfide isomerase/thioredoxin